MGEVIDLIRSAHAVIFDFYGTLAGDRASIPSMCDVLTELGYRSHPNLESMYEPDGFDGTVTPTSADSPGHDEWIRDNWRGFARRSGVPAGSVEYVVTRLLDVRATYRAAAVPGAVKLVAALRARGRAVGLCTNWENSIQPYLVQAGLPEFDAVVTSAEIGARKPHPRIFQAVCEKLAVAPEATVFVGDNWFADVVGAMRVDMTPVWLRNGRPTRGLTDLVPEFDTLADFAEFIERLEMADGGNTHAQR